MSFQWFRMWVDAMDDEKLKLLAFEDRWHFVAILCCKRKGILDAADEPGMRDRKVGAKLGLADRDRDEVRRRLMEVGLIDSDWQPLAWGKRQFVSDADPTANQRKKKQREKERHGRVTRDNRDSHAPVTGTSLEGHAPQTQITDSDSEKDPSLRSGGDARKRASTAQRLPDNFELTEERKATARAEAVNPEREFARFCDHWRASAGTNGRKRDWDAAWRNWCRKAADFSPRRANSGEEQAAITWRPPEDEHA